MRTQTEFHLIWHLMEKILWGVPGARFSVHAIILVPFLVSRFSLSHFLSIHQWRNSRSLSLALNLSKRLI